MDNVVHMYTELHLPLRQIAKLVGKSHVAVYKQLRKAGVTAEQGEKVKEACAFCGNEIILDRARWHRNKLHFCNKECYGGYLEFPGYKPWRDSRLARAIVSQYFRLEGEYYVGFKDKDSKNIDRNNLIVFRDFKDYIKYCQGKEVDILWDGKYLVGW